MDFINKINLQTMIIYLDFDGTVVEHAFPKIGRFVPHALRVIKLLQDKGHQIILNTARCESRMFDSTLEKALDYFEYNQFLIEIAIAGCCIQKLHPHPWNLDKDLKELYIDDIATNIPLMIAVFDGYTMVDWLIVEKQLIDIGIL